MQAKKYRSFFVVLSCLGLSAVAFAQNDNHSSVTMKNVGQKTIYATYDAIGGHEEKAVTLDAQQAIELPLNANETGIHVIAMNGQEIPVNHDSEHACTAMAKEGNSIKLQFNAERMSCQSNEP